ncbi:hypothetical protein CC86DRAFT_410120 [Ophiobolus disseminans]|uniref:Uncharacterized protein n=1 Tax=Ophiobolus disseminans TaxID=1469910 RepID=A0A6A6ZN38_9PLEO|nr:hypothetical protein CC86DRAFT_410120 [Ophiobolus disseminans]
MSHTRLVRDSYALLTQQDPACVWVTDSEGVGSTKTGLAGIPTEFAIVLLHDPSKEYSGFFRYAQHPNAASIVREVKAKQIIRSRMGGGWSVFLTGLVRGLFDNQHKQDRGLTVEEYRRQLYGTLVFDEDTAVVVKWGYTKLDIDTASIATKFPVVDLLHLFRYCTNLGHLMTLSKVWEGFHPGQDVDLRWHLALGDARATSNLAQIFIQEMGEVPEEGEDLTYRLDEGDIGQVGGDGSRWMCGCWCMKIVDSSRSSLGWPSTTKLSAIIRYGFYIQISRLPTCDDSRLETYHELRACHPKATLTFYAPIDPVTNKRCRLEFSKINLVRGLKRIAAGCMRRKLHNKDLDKTDTKWDVEEVAALIKYMITRSGGYDDILADQIDCNGKGCIVKLPRKAPRIWGPDHKAEDLNSFSQPQHMSIIIKVPIK